MVTEMEQPSVSAPTGPLLVSLHRPCTPPRLAAGVELVGEHRGSGYVEGSYLLRRADKTMIELSRLLFLIVTNIDGRRDVAEISDRVSADYGRSLGADKLAYLIDNKLRPLGVMGDDPSGSPSPVPPTRTRSLTVATKVIPERVVRAAAAVLAPLFWPPVVVSAVAALAAFDTWLALGPGTGQGMSQLLRHPGLLLALAGLTIVAGAFHELGHASASRYGGANPGVIGVGICVIWPAFYNDLNDTYRLSRPGRIRADLGGIYFNVILILVLAAGYAASGYQPLLAIIVIQHLLAAQQLLPFARLDGYYIVSDLAGVPNLFSRAPSIMASLIPGRRVPKKVAELTVRARAIVAVWVVASLSLLMTIVIVFGPRLPRYCRLIKLSAVIETRAFIAAVHAGAITIALVSGIQLLILAVPVIGIAILLARLAARSLNLHTTDRVPTEYTQRSGYTEPDTPRKAEARRQLERILAENSGYEQLPKVFAALGAKD